MPRRDLDIVVCTTPIRPVPTDYPPFGSLAVIQALRAAGYDPYFYDIDGLRPSIEEVERFFRERRPAVLGVSAVVSTAYAYTKKLVQLVKRVSPKTRIVLGGNLAASAEILHRQAGVDYCVAGEGEVVSVNLMRYLEERLASGKPGDDEEALYQVKGVTFIDRKGDLVFTGYELRVAAEELSDPDYGILEKYSRLSNFIRDPFNRGDFAADPRSQEPRRKGKMMGTVITAKGCVARCTFCHRWDKGYRAFPVEHIVRRVRCLMDRYNVGYIQFGDENFGSDRRQVEALLEALKPLDILWQVGGVRCRTVDPGLLKRMKEAGAVGLFYGMETGSARILEVMEKNATLEHNLNAAVWTQQAGLFTIYQLVMGMPGENDQTVRESIEFFKKATEIMPESPLNRLSINYIQALPGTPVYEYARHKGLLGKTLADEERYLELISDIDAEDDTKFINFTDSDYLTVQSWRRRITLECIAHYRRAKGLPWPTLREIWHHAVVRKLWPARYERLRARAGLEYERGGYFNLQRGLFYDVLATWLYPVRTPALWLWLLAKEARRAGLGVTLRRAAEAAACRLRGPREDAYNEYRSLRKVVDAIAPPAAAPSGAAMAPLRAGR
ncbi:MAG: B12-binding domain-containing radical SAM protein [Elusimicrobia bacterium]|nr:B12-binding domain-containing radical SAM protein [Elusimicrobiota bacterium]